MPSCEHPSYLSWCKDYERCDERSSWDGEAVEVCEDERAGNSDPEDDEQT